MEIINMTPHPVTVGGRTFAPSGSVARCTEVQEPAGTLDGIPLVTVRRGPVEGLPAPSEGTYYIVSSVVAAAAGRRDLLVPAKLARDAEGRVIGAEAFAVSAAPLTVEEAVRLADAEVGGFHLRPEVWSRRVRARATEIMGIEPPYGEPLYWAGTVQQGVRYALAHHKG